ncbi:MAG: PAS domain S-box protein [Candidatus Pacebacteria bacterium]|nr:PAS domain S-box protein [Candidatus Paceibacterota bacterium]
MTAIINDKFKKDIFSYEDVENIKKIHKKEINKLSKLLISRDLELEKINENLDIKLLQLEESNKKMEDNKDVLAIRLNAKTKQLKEIIDDLDEKVKRRTKKLEDSQKALIDMLQDLKKAKSKEKEEKEKTLAIINNLSDGLLMFDNKNKLLIANTEAKKFLNLDKKEIIGKSVSELFEFPDMKFFFDIVGKDIKEVFRKEFAIKKNLIIEISTASIIKDNRRVGKFALFHDITREKTVQKLKNEFVSIAAHQLRTPLSAIKWTLTTILDGDLGEMNKEQKKYLQKSNLSNERMISLVNDLLNLSRIEEGKYIQIKNFLKIEDIINEVIVDEEVKTKKKNIIFKFKKDNNIPDISVDKEKIILLIQNLIENAINYCYENTKIYINLMGNKTKNEIQFSITNTGIGIPEELKNRIFTKFFRADNAVKTETIGTGLGLYINKNIVESHGGKIWFESEEKKDTTFYFTLPIKNKVEEF